MKICSLRNENLRKLQIPISQTTDSHFANYRFSFRKLQISISQTTDFHFVSSHFVSQTTVSLLRSGNGGSKETELLQCRRGYDALFGEKRTRVVSVEMRKLNWNISSKFLAKNRGKRSINCDPKFSLCGVTMTRASACLIFLGYLNFA